MNIQKNLALAGFLLAALAVPAAQAAMTPAGTSIVNTANVSYTDPDGDSKTTPSNPETVKVAELLDVTVVKNGTLPTSVLTPSTDQVVSFTVTNTGNGQEVYALTASNSLTGDQFDPANVRIYIDTNGNGLLDGGDVLLDPSVNDPNIAPGANVKILVVSDIPTGLNNGDLGNVRLSAESLTTQATGVSPDPVGTVFAGQGTDGVDAVVGTTQAVGEDTHGYVVRNFNLDLVKTSQLTHTNPALNGKAVPGAIITYTLTLNATGGGTFNEIVITDNIPTHTTYVPGSLTLNGAGLNDLQNGDEGYVQGGVVRVYPGGNDTNNSPTISGTVTAPSTNVVTFQVTIDNL